MSRCIVLDCEPISLLCRPDDSLEGKACRRWARSIVSRGGRVIVPEIADFEQRREFRRAGKTASVTRLDDLQQWLEYLAITTPAMRLAADLWAQARQRGIPTAADESLDCDVILAAQAIGIGDPEVIVATPNLDHLRRYVPADLWSNILP